MKVFQSFVYRIKNGLASNLIIFLILKLKRFNFEKFCVRFLKIITYKCDENKPTF